MKLVYTSVLICFSMLANAGVSSNFMATSDYVWRGVTQTNHSAAIQGGLDYEHESGLSLGTWISNVASLGAEADFYGKYSHAFNDNFSLSLGGTFYHYTKSGVSDTAEINLGLSAYKFDFGVNYIDDYFGTNTSSMYYSLSRSFDLVKKQNLSLALSLGYTTFDDDNLSGVTDYLDYKVSVERTIDSFTVAVFYTDTNRKTKSANVETDVDDHVYGVSVGRSF